MKKENSQPCLVLSMWSANSKIGVILTFTILKIKRCTRTVLIMYDYKTNKENWLKNMSVISVNKVV